MTASPMRIVDGAGPEVDDAAAAIATLTARLAAAVLGQSTAIELLTVAALSGGHVLIEDLPGTGKTTLARALAGSLGVQMSRVQGTADLLPGDITGSMMWNPARGSFDFVPGPIFAEVLMIDELNRIPPRSHSALLEAMQERRVTVDGRSHALPSPFLVIGTQNPFEQSGAHTLPESIIDRFALRIGLTPLRAPDEVDVVVGQLHDTSLDDAPVLLREQFLSLMAATNEVHVARSVATYAVAVVRATREHPAVRLGAGTRASVGIVKSAQALALIRGRDYVTPDDIVTLAEPSLAHRLILVSTGGEPGQAQQVVHDIVERVPVPVP